MLEAGLAKWSHFKWSLDATAHVDQRWSWPEGDRTLCQARRQQSRGPLRSESRPILFHQDLQPSGGRRGCSWRQTFTDSAGIHEISNHIKSSIFFYSCNNHFGPASNLCGDRCRERRNLCCRVRSERRPPVPLHDVPAALLDFQPDSPAVFNDAAVP